MILTMITFIIFGIGIAMFIKGNDKAEFTGILLIVLGAIVTFVLVGVIIGAHAGVDVQIEQNRIEYEALCERLEIANSDLDTSS